MRRIWVPSGMGSGRPGLSPPVAPNAPDSVEGRLNALFAVGTANGAPVTGEDAGGSANEAAGSGGAVNCGSGIGGAA
jgi:hypothetical protein